MIYVFLAEGFEEIEAVAPIDILRRAGLCVKTVGVGQSAVAGSHGITIQTDIELDQVNLDDAQAVVLPGGLPGTENLFANRLVCECVQDAAQRGMVLAAICAAPIILGRLGLLKGRRAICFPGYEEQLAGATIGEERVVIDGNMVTSKGAGSAAEFGFALVGLLKDVETANKLHHTMQFAGE